MSSALYITTHARQAMMQRRVSIDDVLEVIQRPEVTNKGTDGIVRYFRKDLCVVTRPEPRNIVILTALLRSEVQWDNKTARNRPTR